MRIGTSAAIASFTIAVALGGCFYDFSAPFANTDAAGGASASDTTSTETSTSTSNSTSRASSATTTASSTSSATGASASSSSGVTASSSSSTVVEDCTNGVDDDGNGDVDCADPACAAFACTEIAPPTFNGPYLVAVAPAGMAPSCPSGSTSVFSAHAGTITADDATCTKCKCDDSPAPTCSAPTLAFGFNGSCTGTPQTPATTCTNLGLSIALSAQTTQHVTADGSCAPSGGKPTVTPPTFEEDATVCSIDALGGGCPSGSTCAPKGAGGFDVCYEASGDVPCPMGLLAKTSLYESVDDKRDCTSCTCTAGAVSCGDTVNFFSAAGCGAIETSLPDASPCAPAGTVASYDYTPGMPSLACTAGGGAPKGNVTPATLHTICCAM